MTDAEKINRLSSLLEEVLGDEYVSDDFYNRGRSLLDEIESEHPEPEIDERAEFEKWAEKQGLPLELDEYCYVQYKTEWAWHSWNARAALKVK